MASVKTIQLQWSSAFSTLVSFALYALARPAAAAAAAAQFDGTWTSPTILDWLLSFNSACLHVSPHLVPNHFGGLVRGNGRRVGASHGAQNAGPNQRRHGHHRNAHVHGGEREVENGGGHPHLPEGDLQQQQQQQQRQTTREPGIIVKTGIRSVETKKTRGGGLINIFS